MWRYRRKRNIQTTTHDGIFHMHTLKPFVIVLYSGNFCCLPISKSEYHSACFETTNNVDYVGCLTTLREERLCWLSKKKMAHE